MRRRIVPNSAMSHVNKWSIDQIDRSVDQRQRRGKFFETLDFLCHVTIQHRRNLKMLSPIAVLIVDEIVDLLKSIPEGATPEVTDFEHWGKEFASVWVSNI